MGHFRYQVSDATGYVADVRYEGEIIPYIPPVAVPARLEEAERSSSAASEPVTSKGLTPRGSRPGRRNKRNQEEKAEKKPHQPQWDFQQTKTQ